MRRIQKSFLSYNRNAVFTLESCCNNSSGEHKENGAVSEDGHSEGEAILSLFLLLSSDFLSYPYTNFYLLFYSIIFFCTGGDPHSGDEDLGSRDFGGRDLRDGGRDTFV